MHDLELRVWDDPAIRSALSWYLDVAGNRRPAKLLELCDPARASAPDAQVRPSLFGARASHCSVDQAQTKLFCAMQTVINPVFGCAYPHTMVPNVDCTIVIGDEPTLRAWGRTRNLILRHEIGHSNGWGRDHAGAR